MGVLAALIGLTVLALILRAVTEEAPSAPARRALHFLAGALVVYGCVGFFAQGAIGLGLSQFLPQSLEWPVLSPASNVRDAGGATIVGLSPLDRVQVYDAEGRFVRGWAVPASGGLFKVHAADPGVIEVRTARGSRRVLYRLDGTPIESGTYQESLEEFGAGDAPGLSVTAPWPLWPLAHPMIAWLLLAGASFALFGRDGRGARRRKRTRRAKKSE